MTDITNHTSNRPDKENDSPTRNGTPWSQEEDDFLRENYSMLGPKAVGEKLSRTASAVHSRARFLSIPLKNKPWSQEDDDFLRENYPSLGAKRVAEDLGRSESA